MKLTRLATRLLAAIICYSIGGQAVAEPVGERFKHSGNGSTLLRQTLEREAKDGKDEAQFRLGTMLLEGKGGPRDIPRAIGLLEAARAQHNADATYLIGLLHGMGLGYAKNEEKAEAFISEAASYGQPQALGHVGAKLYRNGDYRHAIFWLESAANKNRIPAAMLLAGMLLDGKGTEPDPIRAALWYAWGAERGEPAASIMLGQLLLQGRGTIKSVAEARNCFKLAAADGNAEGLALLASAFVDGPNIKSDEVEAAKWAYIARSLGEERISPRILKNIVPKLSQKDYEKVRDDGKSWIKEFWIWRDRRARRMRQIRLAFYAKYPHPKISGTKDNYPPPSISFHAACHDLTEGLN